MKHEIIYPEKKEFDYLEYLFGMLRIYKDNKLIEYTYLQNLINLYLEKEGYILSKT